jgi:hypothetical protein
MTLPSIPDVDHTHALNSPGIDHRHAATLQWRAANLLELVIRTDPPRSTSFPYRHQHLKREPQRVQGQRDQHEQQHVHLGRVVAAVAVEGMYPKDRDPVLAGARAGGGKVRDKDDRVSQVHDEELNRPERPIPHEFENG